LLFFFNDTPTTEIYTLSLHDALPICDNTIERELSPEARTTHNLRLLGFFPLFFFLAQAIHYWRISELGHMLWMCNIGNLLLAIGLFLNRPLLTRVAVIWLIPGLA